MKFQVFDMPNDVKLDLYLDKSGDAVLEANGIVVLWFSQQGQVFLQPLSEKDKEILGQAGFLFSDNELELG